MKPSTLKIRSWILVAFTVLVVIVFTARLINIQIVDSKVYQNMVQGGYMRTQVVKATRGEIVDRNGKPLAQNRMGYDIVIDRAFFPTAEQNQILDKLMQLSQRLGEEWNDSLPISKTAPYVFLEEKPTELANLKKLANVQDYATAEDVLYWLSQRYDLTEYSLADIRRIAGVRYEMERRGFSIRVPYVFASDVDISSVIQIKEKSYELQGVDVIETAIRQYPQGDIAPHVVGTIGAIYAEEYAQLDSSVYAMDDVIGKEGIEKAFESQLRGKNGQRQITIGMGGQVVDAIENIPPVPGNTVMLTLDWDLQKIAQDSLEAQIKYLQENAATGRGKEAHAGAVVMLDVETGEILALATYPSYNLTTYRQDYSQLIAEGSDAPLLNRALFGQYAPASTFKPVVALAGYKNNIFDDTSRINCTRVYNFYPNHPFTCLGYHGMLDLTNALRVSCNIFFYDVGRRTGITEIDEMARQMGLGEPTGIELAEFQGQRSNPTVKKKLQNEMWYYGDVLQSSIGQLLHKYTPLQLANYTATIANRGKRMEVSIVKEIRDYSMQNVVEKTTPTVAEQSTAPKEAFEAVVKGLVAASGPSGTASATFGNYPITVASKTGTAETLQYPNSNFVTFAPAENPKVAVAVVIEKGWHGYTGAPVAKALYDEYFGFNVSQESVQGAATSAEVTQIGEQISSAAQEEVENGQ